MKVYIIILWLFFNILAHLQGVGPISETEEFTQTLFGIPPTISIQEAIILIVQTLISLVILYTIKFISTPVTILISDKGTKFKSYTSFTI